MLFSDSVIVIVEKLLPFKSLYLLVNASFRRRHVFFVGLILTSHNTQPTAVGDHCREHGHVINKNNVEVLAREEGWFKREVREARDSTCPRSTAKFYLSVSHVIAVVRRAVTLVTSSKACVYKQIKTLER